MGEVELKGLRALRRSRGMTQADLAEAAGFDQYSVSQWERGRRSPRPTTVRKLADALGVEPQELFVEQPLRAPLAEPASAEEVAAFLRSRGGSDLLVVRDEEATRRAMTPGASFEALVDELRQGFHAALDARKEGGISRELRAALKDVTKLPHVLDRLALLQIAVEQRERAEAERFRQEVGAA